MRTAAKGMLGSIVVLAMAAVGAFLVFLNHGVSARQKPWAAEAYVMRRLRHLAIPRSARSMKNPVQPTREVLSGGMAHFADHCAVCHANNGSGGTEMGMGLYPPPPDMRQSRTQELSDGELFYIIENGVRFTGMPAWGGDSQEHREASWHLVHFIRHLPRLTPAEIEKMQGMNPKSPEEWRAETEEERFLRGEDDQPARHPHGHPESQR